MPEIIAAAGITNRKLTFYKRFILEVVMKKLQNIIEDFNPKYSHSYWTFAFYFKTNKINGMNLRKFIEFGEKF